MGQNRPDAAALDWLPLAQMTAAQASQVPGYCAGGYVEPELRRDPDNLFMDNIPINASAAAAIYRPRGLSTLEGDVELSRGATYIKAPFIAIDTQQQQASIQGPLQIRRPGLLFTGESATTNLADDTVTVEGASFLFHLPGIRGSAAKLQQDADQVVRIQGGALTHCEPGSNAWQLRGKTFSLDTAAGVGEARNVTLDVKDVPVLYVPYIRFPLDERRQSGFLLPSLGSDSTGGADLSIPYYFNIAPNLDATYELRSLSRRGLIHDGQVRYLKPWGRNELNLGYIARDDLLRGSDSAPLDPTSNKQDRWYLNLRHQGGLGRWQTWINYNAVSDIDYLQDIGGTIGTDVTARLSGVSDEGPSSRRAVVLDRLGLLTYFGDTWRAQLQFRDFQNLDLLDVDQYAVEPRVSLQHGAMVKGWQWQNSAEYARFVEGSARALSTSNTESLVTGERLLASTQLTYPLRASSGFLTPGVRAVHRRYQLDNDPPGTQSNPSLTTASVFIDGGLVFDRSLSLAGRQLRQSLEPRLYYLYTEYDDQSGLPRFDTGTLTQGYAQLFRANRFSGHDRIADANQLSVGVTSRLTDPASGRELASASLGQIQYFEDRRVLANPLDEPDRSRSPLFAELTLRWHPRISARAQLEWDPATHRQHRRQVSVKYTGEQGRIVNLGYHFTGDDSEYRQELAQEASNLSFVWPLGAHWRGIGAWNFDWDTNQTLQSLAGVEYNNCCWKSRFVIRRFLRTERALSQTATLPPTIGTLPDAERRRVIADTGIFVEVELKGLATLGRRLQSTLNEVIPGFRQHTQLRQ